MDLITNGKILAPRKYIFLKYCPNAVLMILKNVKIGKKNLWFHSVKELTGYQSPYEVVEKLNTFGGFPEPFLSDSERHRAKWENQYYTDLIREDILDFSRVHEIKIMKIKEFFQCTCNLNCAQFKKGTVLSWDKYKKSKRMVSRTFRVKFNFY